MYNRSTYYDGKQRYKIEIIATKEVIEQGFTSQSATMKRIRELRAVYGKGTLGIVGYKEKE